MKHFTVTSVFGGEMVKRAAAAYQPTDSQQRRFPGSNVRRASHMSKSGRGLGSDWESGVKLEADWKPSSSDWSKLDGTYADNN